MKPYEIGLYEKAMPAELSWEEKLGTAKALGYDFVEISIDETDARLARLDMSEADRFALLQTACRAQMPFRSMCLSGHRKYPLGSMDDAVCRRSLEIMEKAVKFAADLGIRVIQLAGYDVYYEESNARTAERFEENLRKAAAMAAKAGVLLGFETMENEFMNTVAKAMKYVNDIHSPYLHVYPDAGNLTNAARLYGTDVYEDLRSGAGHLIALHLKETVPGKFREVPFATGHVDFEKIIDTAWDLGVRRYVTEMWYVGQTEWKEDIRFAHNLMIGLLDRKAESAGQAAERR